MTEKCGAKIKASNCFPIEDGGSTFFFYGECNESSGRSPEGITALFYDEEQNKIYSGSWLGIARVWSNR